MSNSKPVRIEGERKDARAVMSAAKVTALKPRAIHINELPINVVNDNLAQAYATLDLLYELTLATDADERIGSLGAKQLNILVHGIMVQIEQATEAVEKLSAERAS